MFRKIVLALPSDITPLSANPAKWSNTLKQFVGKLPTNCLSVFDHFVTLALKGLTLQQSVFPHIGIGQLITSANKSTGFYMNG